MKKLALLALMACGSSAFAGPIVLPVPQAMPEIKEASPFSFEIGLTRHQETYTEYHPETGGTFMKETAAMTGIKGTLEHTLSREAKAVYSASYLKGDADYTGAYMGNAYGSLELSGLGRELIEITGEYKLKPQAWNKVGLNAGLGYRRLVDNLQEGGPGGYKRTNQLLYATLGVERDIHVYNWTITPAVKYKHLIRGVQSVDIDNLSMTQEKGKGGEISVRIARLDANGSGLVVEPFVRLWDIERSKDVKFLEVLYASEPRNKTKEVGVNVSWRF